MSNEADEVDGGSPTGSAAMHQQLRSDVASWKAARDEDATRRQEFAVPAARPAAAKPVARSKPAKSAAATAALPPDSKKKPFGMSYDGMSQADYITYMISRGAR